MVAYSDATTGRPPLYCPMCRPRIAPRGGAGGLDTAAPAYRLALAVTTLRLGIEQARRLLNEAHLDQRAGEVGLRRSIAAALAALEGAETERTRDLVPEEMIIDVSENQRPKV